MCTACTCVFAICRGRKFLVNCFTFVVAPSNIPMQYYESERPKTDNIFRCLYILGVYIARTKNSFLCAKTINILAYIGISIAQQNPTSYTSSTLNCIFWYTNQRSSLFLHKILTARHLTNQSVHIFFIRLCCAVRALFCWLCKCSFQFFEYAWYLYMMGPPTYKCISSIHSSTYIFNRICFFSSMYIYWHRILYRCNQVCSQYCNIDRMELKRKYFQRNRYFLSFRMHTWTSVFFLHMLVSVSRQMFRHGLCFQFENNLLKINNPCFEFSVILHTTQPFEKYS